MGQIRKSQKSQHWVNMGNRNSNASQSHFNVVQMSGKRLGQPRSKMSLGRVHARGTCSDQAADRSRLRNGSGNLF